MSNFNKVMLMGNLGADPEMRYTQGGTAVANFRIATTERWKDVDGAMQERTDWHRIVVWGKQGETCGEHLRRGRGVLVEGRLQNSEWEDKNGNKRWTTEVKADRVLFLAEGSKTSGEPHEPVPGENEIPF
ncbi:MAG: single-stranded DNA-binding protein [Deltaproteobacteria bacterium]|jgi:single-strand DNA-binding protein